MTGGWFIITCCYACSLVLANLWENRNKYFEELEFKNIMKDGTFDKIYNEWVELCILKINIEKTSFVIDKLKSQVNALPPEHISIYSAHFNTLLMALFMVSFGSLYYYVFLTLFESVRPDYEKRLADLIEEINWSSYTYNKKEEDKGIYYAHLNILEKLAILSETEYLEFYDFSQFNEISDELKIFYSIMKTTNRREFLLNIHAVQLMLISISLTNKSYRDTWY